MRSEESRENPDPLALGSGVVGTLRYSVRRSPRARHARLIASPRDGLIVVVPRRFNLKLIPQLVSDRADWAERALERIEIERATVGAVRESLPTTVDLRAIGESWVVEYTARPSQRVTVRPIDGGHLLVSGSSSDDEARAAALCRWLTRQGQTTLVPWVESLAERHDADVVGVSVRAQRSRWASCSVEGRINVNRAVLFLPRALAQHVLLHEICHRVEMSHSPRFWSALEAIDPQTAAHRAALRSAWKYVPDWAGPPQLSGRS